MARVTHVKRAQQRYETVPVLGPDGQPVKIPVMRSDGTQKMTRAKGGRPGRPVFMTKTVADKTKPLPNEQCGKCGVEIKPGDPYKHISPKSGPYGGRRLVRCAACPTWYIWEYSSSTSARIAQITHEAETALDQVDTAESADDIESVRDDIAQMIREYSEEKAEAADNIENGFGHETSQSDEIRQVADGLEGWADEVESADYPEYPEAEEVDCDDSDFHDEDREYSPDDECPKCQGSVTDPGVYTPDDPTEDQINDWRGECRDALQSVIDSCPV